jgi:hypothetical protein
MAPNVCATLRCSRTGCDVTLRLWPDWPSRHGKTQESSLTVSFENTPSGPFSDHHQKAKNSRAGELSKPTPTQIAAAGTRYSYQYNLLWYFHWNSERCHERRYDFESTG